MPERLDRVVVATSSRDVILPWASRDALLDQISHLEFSGGIRRAFEAVGASLPLRLTNEEKGDLVGLIDIWTVQLGRGWIDLPQGVWELRNALMDDLRDAGVAP
jgi:hypothetical protein